MYIKHYYHETFGDLANKISYVFKLYHLYYKITIEWTLISTNEVYMKNIERYLCNSKLFLTFAVSKVSINNLIYKEL